MLVVKTGDHKRISKGFAKVQPDAYETPQYSDITSRMPDRYNLLISGDDIAENLWAFNHSNKYISCTTSYTIISGNLLIISLS